MGSYENFARVYDELMDNVPYEEWAQFILNLLQDRKITEGLVLELGCGTGKLMTLLGKAGFDMIGVDNSVEMLQIAREKTSQDFLYLLQDMRLTLKYLYRKKETFTKNFRKSISRGDIGSMK